MISNTKGMYFRPGNLFKEFVVDANEQKVTSSGRVVNIPQGEGSRLLKGCLADASGEDKANHSIQDHTVTHTIIHPGPPKAKRTDKLILGERIFYIVDVDDAGSFGISTIYYAEERLDVK